MHLAQLRAENFRLFQGLSLQPHRRLNLVLGANAAGKTSLLEAIYCLARAKSFRSSSPAELAGKGQRGWVVSGEFQEPDRPPTLAGVSWDAKGTQVRLNREPAGTLDLVRRLPVQIMEPGMHRLLQEGPGYRRSFLDWGVFHVEPSFIANWRRFHRALKQRNHALRTGAGVREIQAWNPELAESAMSLQALRMFHVEQLRQKVGEHVQRLLGLDQFSLELSPGWSGTSYPEALEAGLERDRRQGMTVEGPHRAELRIRLQDHQVKNRISRGQQKLMICALILAQAGLIRTAAGQAPILLLDDFGAELATAFQQSLLTELQAYPGQVFLTAFDLEGVLSGVMDASMFHVEQGRLTPA